MNYLFLIMGAYDTVTADEEAKSWDITPAIKNVAPGTIPIDSGL